MDFRAKRQFTILAILVAAIGGVLLFIGKSAIPEPTCSDGRRNQGEEAADCGGPCMPCELRNRRDIEIFWARFVKVRPDAYDVAAEISNPNGRLAAISFEYEFKLFDSVGVAVASRRGVGFLYPGEVLHPVEIGLTSKRTIRNATFTARNVQWVLADRLGPDIIAGNREHTVVEEGGVRRSIVTATLTNRTITDAADVALHVLVFDAGGNLLGVHRTVVANLQAGEALPVRFVWPGVIAEDPGSITIEARSGSALPQSAP